jgi:hypothetical protein
MLIASIILEAAVAILAILAARKGKPVGGSSVVPQALLKPRWSVYLRSNTENTDTGDNTIRGIIQENQCVRVLTPYPGIRGQTWAAVKLADCDDHR